MTQVAQQQCTDAETVIVIKSPTEPSSTAVVTNNPSVSITAGAVPGPHAQGKEQGQDGNDNSSSKRQAIKLSIRAYFSQWKGGVETPLKPEDPLVLLYSFAGAFTSILIIACINQYASPQPGFNVVRDWGVLCQE